MSRRWLALLIGLCAAGCDDGPAAEKKADLAGFIGTWTVTKGSAQATMCQGIGDLPAQPLDGTSVNVVAGTDAPLELTVSRCTFKFDVQGKIATARAGQSCMTAFTFMGIDFPVKLTVSSATFTLEEASGSLVQNGQAEATSPFPVTCTYKATATGTKAAPGDAGAGAG